MFSSSPPEHVEENDFSTFHKDRLGALQAKGMKAIQHPRQIEQLLASRTATH
jgi:hypothetical protein